MDFSETTNVPHVMRPIQRLIDYLKCGDIDAFEHVLIRIRDESDSSTVDWIACVDALMDYADVGSHWLQSLLSHLVDFTASHSSHANCAQQQRPKLDQIIGRLHLILGDSAHALDCFYRSISSPDISADESISGLLGIIEGQVASGNNIKARELLEFLQVTQPSVNSIPRYCLLRARVTEDITARLQLLQRCRELIESNSLCVSLVLSLCNEFVALQRYRDSVDLLRSAKTNLPWPSQAVETLLGVSLINCPQLEQEGLELLAVHANTSASAAVALSRYYIPRDMHGESDSVLSLCTDLSLLQTPHYALWKCRFGHSLSDCSRISILLAASSTHPTSPQDTEEYRDLATELVSLLIRSDQVERGLDIVANQLPHCPKNSSVVLTCRLLVASKRYEEALETLSIDPQTPTIVEMKKEILLQLDRFSDYMALLPTDVESMADGFMKFGKPQDAIRWYSQIDSPSWSIRMKICEAYLLSHDFAKAMDIVERMIEDSVDSEECLYFCFKVLIELEQFDKCWEWYEKIPNLSVRICELLVSLCESKAWFDRGIRIASACIDRGSAVVGRLALVTLTESLGLMCLKKGKMDEGMFWLGKVVHDTDRLEVVNEFVKVLEMTGDVDRASAVLREQGKRFLGVKKIFRELSATPSEVTLNQLAASPAGPWRVVSLVIENRRLANREFSISDLHATLFFKSLTGFELDKLSQLPSDCQDLAKFVFGLVWMIEGRIGPSSDWFDKNCPNWASIDPDSTSLLRKFFVRQPLVLEKLVYRNCVEFLVTELIDIQDPKKAKSVCERDWGCMIAWRVLGQGLGKDTAERYQAFEEYFSLGGHDDEILLDLAKRYYKTRQYMRLLQLYHRHPLPALKKEYEKSKIKLFRAY